MKRFFGRFVCWLMQSHSAMPDSGQFAGEEFSVLCRRCGRRCAMNDDGWYLV